MEFTERKLLYRRERIKAGDLFRTYVHPEHGCCVFAVHPDQQAVTMLNTV